MYLDWHLTNTRKINYYLIGCVYKNRVTHFKDDHVQKHAEDAINFIENNFLADKDYLASKDHPTVADLQCLFELAIFP